MSPVRIAIAGSTACLLAAVFTLPANAADAPTPCVDGPSPPVPRVRGLPAEDARHKLVAAGFRVREDTWRPSDGMQPGHVMQSNPRDGVVMCGRREIQLYVAEASSLRNFRGDTIAKARKAIAATGQAAGGFEFMACGQSRGSTPTDPKSKLVVWDQSPDEGTSLNKLRNATLRLAPRDDFWMAFPGQTLRSARRQLEEAEWLAGWRIADNPGDNEGRKVLAATGDRETCQIHLTLAPVLPRSAETVASAPQTGCDDEPLTPVVPLATGALGALALSRVFSSSRQRPERALPPEPDTVVDNNGFRVRCDLGRTEVE